MPPTPPMPEGPAQVFHVVEQPWRWFEEMETGKPFACGGFTFGEDEIVGFARRFDPQPFHVDPAAARASFVGELFASAIHTLAASVGIYTRATRRLDLVIGMDLRETELPRPARANVPLTVRARWVSVRPSRSRPELGLAVWEAETVTADDELVARFGSTIMVRRRDYDGAGTGSADRTLAHPDRSLSNDPQ